MQAVQYYAFEWNMSGVHNIQCIQWSGVDTVEGVEGNISGVDTVHTVKGSWGEFTRVTSSRLPAGTPAHLSGLVSTIVSHTYSWNTPLT